MIDGFFLNEDYRNILNLIVTERKRLDSSLNFQRLATAMRIQKPYLSKVIKKAAHLNEDQLFLAIQFLAIPETHADYLFLLLNYTRSSNQDRKKLLLKKIRSVQKTQKLTHTHLQKELLDEVDATEYYLDPLAQIVHLALTLDQYVNNWSLIYTTLGLAKKQVLDRLRLLEKLRIISIKEGKIEVHKSNLHLPSASPLCKPNQILMRQASLTTIRPAADQKDQEVAITFSADEETREKIRERFFQFIKQTEKQVQTCKATHVYQLNFDLFKWL